jgi:tetratricopeptide (TPR) repeat protein
MRRRCAQVLFSLLLLVPTTCFGQQEPLKKTLSGYVREEGSGQVISEARIELQNAMGTPIGFVYSDRNGTYEFDDIPGDCYVSVQHEGYAPLREYVRPDGSGHVYKDVLLRPADREPGSVSATPVSEHQLSIPPKARDLFLKGIQLVVEKSDYRGAVAQFARAISRYPSYYEAYAAMGLAQNKMGDAAAAETALRKSIDLSAEKYPQAMIDLASMYNGQKRFADAEPLFRKVIALSASSWRGQFELAVALAGQQRFKEAVTCATTARDLKPENPQVYLLLYNLHIHTNDFAGALSDTEAYLKLTPDGATADRVRRMQEQVRRAAQTSGADPGTPSEATPVSAASAANVDSAAPTSGAAGNFTPVDSGFAPADRATASAPAAATNAPGPTLGAERPVPASDATAPANPSPAPAPSVPEAANAPGAKDSVSVEASTAPEPKSPSLSDPRSIIPARVDEIVPEVAVDVPCSLPSVLQGAGERAEQLLSTLQKFDAFERVEHYKLNAAGVPGAADERSFEYVLSVSHDAQGGFQLQEYRNGSVVQPREFPSGILTANLTAHGLIFHPLLAKGFRFTCEGLGEWKGHPTWIVGFEEKQNGLTPFRDYVVNGARYAVRLTGRAWIDAGTFQILRLESDLLKPVEKIRLTREHIAIEYASVQFRTRDQQLWLPQSADLYVEWDGKRFYRRHTFSNFKIFSTDSTQEVHALKDSYCFTNTTGLLITGVLTATPVAGTATQAVSITLSIPAKGTVCKSVGTGKDLNIPLDALASTSFTHDGPAGAVEVDAYVANQRAVEVIPSGNTPVNQNP